VPKFLEDKLKAQAGKEGLTGQSLAHYVYGAMNNMGAMHGNKETTKGRAMDAKHEADQKKPSHHGANLGKFLHPKRKP